MTARILVVAPHPDDETLGCGGTLLRLAHEGAQIAWLIVTSMSATAGFAGGGGGTRRRNRQGARRVRLLRRFQPAAADTPTGPVSGGRVGGRVRRRCSSRSSRRRSFCPTVWMCIAITARYSMPARPAPNGSATTAYAACLPTRHCRRPNSTLDRTTSLCAELFRGHQRVSWNARSRSWPCTVRR